MFVCGSNKLKIILKIQTEVDSWPVTLSITISLQVERLRSMAEVSLIFFYAPWCAHSMAARHEVQQVAKKLAKQVQDKHLQICLNTKYGVGQQS